MKKTVTVIIEIDGVRHTLRAEVSMLTGHLSIFADADQIVAKYCLVLAGQIASFNRWGRSFDLRFKGMGMFGQLVFTIDGNELPTGTAIAPARPQAPQPQSPPQQSGYTFLREINVVDHTDILGQEEYPLDNLHGSSRLELEQELSRSTTVEMVVKQTVGGDIRLDGNLFMALKAEISAHLSRETSRTVGSTITRKQILRMSVESYSRVTYVVTWKRKQRTGEYLVAMQNNVVSVPYQIWYDLTCDILSR
ncbi:MAG: hypothetical protein NVS4B8_17750 [Herpetosiphon sp.]